MVRKFKRLRRAIEDAGYQLGDIVKLWGKSRGYLDTHLSGQYPWTMEDIYIIGKDILGLPDEELLAHFSDPAVQYHRPGSRAGKGQQDAENRKDEAPRCSYTETPQRCV